MLRLFVLFNVSGYNDGFCQLQAIVSQFFSLSSFLWTAAISHASYATVKNMFTNSGSGAIDRNGIQSTEALQQVIMMKYHFICWGLPFLSVVAMVMFGKVGEVEGLGNSSCWLVIPQYSETESTLSFWIVALALLFPLVIVEMYNTFVLRSFANMLNSIPFSRPLLSRFRRWIIQKFSCAL